MKNFKFAFCVIIVGFGILSCTSNIRNMETATVKVEGNCDKCAKHIEESGSRRGVSTIKWDDKSKMAQVSFNTKRTTLDDVMKKVANAGYHNDLFPADQQASKKVPDCCKYTKDEAKKDEEEKEKDIKLNTNEKREATFMKASLEAYLELKDGLTIENVKETNEAAKKLNDEVAKIDITLLPKESVEDFRLKQDKLEIMIGKLMETKDFKVQRTQFSQISDLMRDLIRKNPLDEPVYVKQCKEKSDRVWLSVEKDNKNPYEGYELLTCGDIIETIVFKK